MSSHVSSVKHRRRPEAGHAAVSPPSRKGIVAQSCLIPSENDGTTSTKWAKGASQRRYCLFLRCSRSIACRSCPYYNHIRPVQEPRESPRQTPSAIQVRQSRPSLHATDFFRSLKNSDAGSTAPLRRARCQEKKREERLVRRCIVPRGFVEDDSLPCLFRLTCSTIGGTVQRPSPVRWLGPRSPTWSRSRDWRRWPTASHSSRCPGPDCPHRADC